MFKTMFKLIGEIHPSTYFIAFLGTVIMLLSVDWVSPFFGWWLVLIAIANERHLTMRALDGVVRTPKHCEHGYNGLCPVCDASQTPPRK
ncbi:MAG TPA: hypothetical protein VI755_11725 [Anaerolineales bacterium]|nr:hypothetical protein [Anaerolineales bacterium]